MLVLEARRLRSLARSRRTQQKDVQRQGDPCLPYRVADAVAGALAPRNAALQFGLLDEVAILMREHVALDLADRVDRDVDDDQQAGAAKLERKARLRDEIFGDQTDRRQIGRTEYGTARQHEKEIGGGVLDRAAAGNGAVLLFEIVGGFFGIEDDRDVEEIG